MALNLLDLIENIQTPSSSSEPTNIDPISITSVNKSRTPDRPSVSNSGDFSRSIYNNAPDIEMAKQGQAMSGHKRSMGGTLRDVLGILGDAMLVHSGKSPIYSAAVQNKKIADAMTGFQSDPRAAAGRLAAIPGAAKQAQDMYDSSEQQQLRMETQKSNENYKQSLEADRQDKRNTNTMQYVAGILKAGAATGDPKKYSDAYKRAQEYASQRNIDDISQYGAPDQLEDAQSGFGMTANQVTRDLNTNKSIDQRTTAADQRDATTRRGQDMRPQPKPTQPTANSITQDLINKRNSGGELTAAEQEYWDANVANKNKGKQQLHIPGLTVGGQSNSAPKAPVPSASDAAYLKSNPQYRAQFDAHFGQGASKKVLGK